ncbi:MAG: adenosylcobinamide-GDP ribazoletransferase [Anaerolineales bacterium]|nr:adenosylcobinamide-GDP ribazoletransferase [Anaerolineales bacterium]
MWLAFSFLTTLPVPRRWQTAPLPGDLGRAALYFPLVGLVLGALLAAGDWLAGRTFPELLSGALVVALWAALTGGLHLDGLADCGDGLPAAATPERRLEIMRDPRLGTFGGLSLILFVLLKVLAVAGLGSAGLGRAAPLLIAPLAGRWLLLLMARQPNARPGGLGADFALGLQPRALWAVGAATLLVALLGGWRGLLGLALAHGEAWLVWQAARARLGGVTGDVLGLTVELSELVVLLAFSGGGSLS